ncbi:MAG: Ig-like domain-containing protein [Clostridia bacterium]|nr:Ig-like domain-containing protein [Clostridia bacterium]
MKKIISVLLLAAVLISTFSLGVSAASDAYKATWTLKASVLDPASTKEADRDAYKNASNKIVYDSKNTPTVSVYPGQVVWVTLHLKTGSSYYPASLQAQIYYTNNILESTNLAGGKSYIWNKTDKFSKICYQNGTPYAKMTDSYKATNYPETWSDEKKASTEFYSVIMYPDPNVTTQSVANIDEDLVTVPIYVKSNAKAGAAGSVFITGEDMKCKKNPTGKFILSYYENGDMTTAMVSYSDKTSFDTSKGEIKFVVADKNASAMSVSPSSLDLKYKEKAQLTAAVKNKPDAKVTWESSNTKVAVVDAEGNVTATGKGTAVITAKYGNYKAECNVKVRYTFAQMLIRIFLLGFLWY